jgi:hypothetical protein
MRWSLLLALVIATASVASAHYNSFNAANSNGRIVFKYNDSLWQQYRDFSNKAYQSWNEVRASTGSSNFPYFLKNTGTYTNTMNVGSCSGSAYCNGSVWGYHQHYPGTKQDEIRFDQALL